MCKRFLLLQYHITNDWIQSAETVRVVVEAEAKSNSKEVEKRRLEEQVQAKEISADAGAK
jgi:hypothetical protein